MRVVAAAVCLLLLAASAAASWEALYNFAKSAEQSGELDEAFRQYKQALVEAAAAAEASPAAANALHVLHNQLGSLFLRVNRLGEAHSHFASAAALAPAQPLYAFNVGLSLMEQQETVRAAAAFLTASTAGGYFPEALYRRGICLDSMSRYNEAVEAFTAALSPSDAAEGGKETTSAATERTRKGAEETDQKNNQKKRKR